jgi:hypothetical protein
MFNFEKLEVWQEAINFADSVYAVTRTFPDGERFGLTNQMRRAAVFISSNIAEGSSRSSRTDLPVLLKSPPVPYLRSFHKRPFPKDRVFYQKPTSIFCIPPVKNKAKC